MLKAIIFDMDGVISDSERYYVDVKNDVLAHFGIYDVPYEYHMQFVGTTHAFQWEHMSKDYHKEDITVQEYLDYFYPYKDAYFEKQNIGPIRGVVDFIHDVKAAGYPISVASSGTIEEIERMLKKLGLFECFDGIASGWECKESKPAPDVYLLAAEKIGVEPEHCLVIEDAPNGAIGAKAAGMYCLGFSNADFPMSKMEEADSVFTQYEDISIKYLENLMK